VRRRDARAAPMHTVAACLEWKRNRLEFLSPMIELVRANAEYQYSVTSADLPLSCPMPGMYLWNSHPKVYLPIEPSGWAKCAYCGAEFTLVR
jgi:uncharacterized Zn-finger protein